MELQAVTASAAIGITRVTIALFMLGMYMTARRDKCTAYWAVSSILMGIGSTTPLYGAASDPLGMWFASCLVIASGVCWWWGLRLFFGRTASVAGWWIIGANALIIGVLFLTTSAQPPRLLAFAFSVLLGLVLVAREAWRGDGTPLTVGRAMVAISYTVSPIAIIARAVYFLIADIPVSPLSNHPVSVTLLYLVPLTCSILASVGTLLIYLQRTVAEKDYLATHDDLTQLFNRRALGNAGRAALSASDRDHGVSLLLIDVDHFKSVNDTLGHEAGDDVLRLVAGTLAANCRRTDVIGRQGGEEFCIICPGTDIEEARRLGEQMLQAVTGIAWPGGAGRPLSISIGIAAGGADTNWDAMLHSADEALYAAKAAGRGQAIVA
ncbi:GGDEF domain-containing protein [Emcibacter sp. SYSU 3D8]|uniref:GGDEF domain-containing protein n=1 Tax=Emcibacter sp. SYSU 3D8 TaxID=3133969 RepID=UPI0031FF089A